MPFAKSSVEYLGHVVSKDGLKPAERNLMAVRNFPVPRDVAAVGRFLGLAWVLPQVYFRILSDGCSIVSIA